MRIRKEPQSILMAWVILLGSIASACAADRLSEPLWAKRHQIKMAQAARGNYDIIFIGDSITRNFERSEPGPYLNIAAVWQAFYGRRKAFNLGFSGDTTDEAIWRITNGELGSNQPKLFVVELGVNDLVKGRRSPSETVVAIQRVVDTARSISPLSKFLVIGIVPNNRTPRLTKDSEQVNKLLAGVDWKGAGATVFDPTSIFVNDGRMRVDFYLDRTIDPSTGELHPNALGMEAIATSIEPTVCKVLGDCR